MMNDDEAIPDESEYLIPYGALLGASFVVGIGILIVMGELASYGIPATNFGWVLVAVGLAVPICVVIRLLSR